MVGVGVASRSGVQSIPARRFPRPVGPCRWDRRSHASASSYSTSLLRRSGWRLASVARRQSTPDEFGRGTNAPVAVGALVGVVVIALRLVLVALGRRTT